MYFVGAAAIIAADEEAERQRRVDVRQIRIRRQQIRDTSNPFGLDPEYFRKLYRMPPHLALNLVDLLHEHIMGNNPSSIPVHVQVLCALRFFAEGGYQKAVGQDHHHPVSQSTVSTAHQIPGVLEIIDCVLVAFVRPCENEEAFYNHRGFHAMNVQIISDADLLIRSIRVCPGSNNDRFVWQFSDAKEHFERLRMDEDVTRVEGRYYILGDSGYMPSPILLTPLRDAVEGTPGFVYTHEFVGTRCRIEELFWHWTAVFRSIKRERKPCYRDPQKVAKFITACAVLHSYHRIHMHNLQEIQGPHQQEVRRIDNVNVDLGYQAGLAERDEIIETYYM